MQALSSSGVEAGMFIIDKKGAVQVVDFVSQQGRIFIRCRQFICTIIKPFIFHFDKIRSVDYFPLGVGQRQTAFVTAIGSALFNNFRVEEHCDLSMNTAGDQPLRDPTWGAASPLLRKALEKKPISE